MNASDTTTMTRERISNNKLALFLSILASFFINLFMVILLSSSGISFVYILFPILICSFDLVFFITSIFTNYRFSYSSLYKIIFVSVFAIISLIYAAVLMQIVSDTKAIAITYISIALWAVVTIASAIAVIIGANNASQRKHRISSLVSILVLLICIGTYAYHITSAGFFGQGADAKERPVTFVYDEKNDYYVATGLVDAKGKNAFIPETFNGKKVGAIDCALLSSKNLGALTVSCDDIVFTNTQALVSLPDDFEIRVSKNHISPLMAQIYTLATNYESNANELISLATKFAPNDLSGDEVCILFRYDLSVLSNSQGKFIPAWIGSSGEAFNLKYAESIDYVKNSDKNNESLLASLYNAETNNGGYILSDLKDQNGNSLLGSKIYNKLTTVNVSFDKIYRLEIMSDNDTKYEIDDSFRYLNPAETNLRYRFVTADSAKKFLSTVEKRNGFDLSWKISDSQSSVSNNIINLADTLLTSSNDSFKLYPNWSLKAPQISVCTTANGSSEYTYGDNIRFTSTASAPINELELHYRWTLGDTTVAESDSFDISKIKMTEAGDYTLTVTAYSDSITSLTSEATETFPIKVNKKQLPIEWIGIDGTDGFTTVYTSSSYHPAISYDSSVIVSPTDKITYYFSNNSIKDVGNYKISINLSGDCADKYVITELQKYCNYVIEKKEVEIVWTVEEYTYKNALIAPSVAISSGVCYGDDLTVSTVGQKNVGNYRAEAILNGRHAHNYVIKTAQRNCDYTIKPATISINWSDTEKVYTSKNLVPTTTVSGLQPGDTEKILNMTLICDAKNAGTYTAKVQINNPNYVISDATKENPFVILPAELTLQFSNIEQIYAGKNLSPSYKVISGKCVADTTDSLNITVGSAKNAGIHTLQVTVGNPNYRLASASQSVELTIKQKEITVSWETQKNLVYSGAAQYLNIKSATGIVSGDDVIVIVDAERSRKTYVGNNYTSYAILSGNEDLIPNYTIKSSTVSSSYSITAKPLTLTWSNTSFTYDGQYHLPTAKIPVGATYGTDIVNVTVTGQKINAINNAQATATIDNANYSITNPTKKFTISPKSLTVVWNIPSFTYNGQEQKPEASINSGLIGADTVTLSVSGAKFAGTHTATATISNGNTNYNLSNPTTIFTIAKKVIDVSWNVANTFVYNATNQAPTVTLPVGQAVSGDTVNITVNGAKKNVGSYTATAVSSNSNYSVSEATATYAYSITPLTVSVSFTNTEKTYTGSALTPDVTLVGKPSADSVSLTFTVLGYPGGAKNVGTYSVTVSTANQNYVLDPATTTLSTFRIVPKTVSASWNKSAGSAYTYDGTVKSPRATVQGLSVTYTYEKYNTETRGYEAIAEAPTEIGIYRVTAVITSNNYTLTNRSLEYSITAPVGN